MEGKKTNKKLIIGIVVGIIAIIAIALTLILVLGNKNHNIAGTYDLVGMKSEGEEVSKDDIDLMKQYGLNVYLQVQEDNTGVLNMFGERLPFKYDKENFIINNEICSYSISKEKLTLKMDTEELIFQKVDPSTIQETTVPKTE